MINLTTPWNEQNFEFVKTRVKSVDYFRIRDNIYIYHCLFECVFFSFTKNFFVSVYFPVFVIWRNRRAKEISSNHSNYIFEKNMIQGSLTSSFGMVKEKAYEWNV